MCLTMVSLFTAPTQVTALMCTPNSGTALTVDWTTSNEVLGYQVLVQEYRSGNQGGVIQVSLSDDEVIASSATVPNLCESV